MSLFPEKYTAMFSCPRFHTCSVPLCLLDPDRDERSVLKGEKTCTMSEAQLERIRRLVSGEEEGYVSAKVVEERREGRDELYKSEVL